MDVLTKIIEIEAVILKLQDKVESMVKAKDKVFELISELKLTFSQFAKK